MGRYKLTNEKLLINNSGTTLYRIMATEDFDDVLSGDTGGWVQNKKNLSDMGWVYDNAKVYDNGLVSGNAKVFDNVIVCENANINGFSELHNNIFLGGKSKVGGSAKLYTDINLDVEIEINKDSWSGITYFIGSKDIVWQESKDTITIGCEKRSIDIWLSDFQTIGIKNNYTQTEIDEYEVYIQQIADLYT